VCGRWCRVPDRVVSSRARRRARRRLAVLPGRPASTVEREPADVVPPSLVVEDELTDCVRQLAPLPPTLRHPCTLHFPVVCCRPYGFDGIGSGTQFVRSDVCDTRGLAGCVRGEARSTSEIPCRAVGVASSGASLAHRDLTARPGSAEVDRPTRTLIVRSHVLEVLQDMLGAGGRPQGKEPMIRVGERPTPTDGHQTRIAHPRENHTQRIARTPAGSAPSEAGRDHCYMPMVDI
jgi:hypothetical protein